MGLCVECGTVVDQSKTAGQKCETCYKKDRRERLSEVEGGDG